MAQAPVPWTVNLPYIIHYLDGRTQQVNAGVDPDSYLTSYWTGPGQHVYQTAGIPAPPPGHGK